MGVKQLYFPCLGPATQVRWLQQDRELVFSQFRQHHQPQPAAASRRLLPQRSASSMGQMPQPNTNFRNTPPHRPGPGNYSSVSSTQRYRFASPNPASEEMPYLPSE